MMMVVEERLAPGETMVVYGKIAGSLSWLS